MPTGRPNALANDWALVDAPARADMSPASLAARLLALHAFNERIWALSTDARNLGLHAIEEQLETIDDDLWGIANRLRSALAAASRTTNEREQTA